jgi:hypothetical protein
VLGRTDARAVQALDADPGLAAELERRIRAAWAVRRGRPVGDGVTR